jgi:DNA-binding beta-propeller fold protein YncE
VDADDVVAGLNQSTAPRNNRGLALSPDERFLYLSYILNKYLVRKIDLSVADPADNHNAVVAQLILPSGSQPARDIATDDRGRVYLALGDKIEIYNANLQTPPLHTISGFTACEGVAVRREKGKLAVYATDRLDKTLERFVLIDGAGEAIIPSRQGGLDGDGEVTIAGANSPAGLDLGKHGSVWIADAGKGKVYRVNAAGKTADSTVVERAMDVAIDTTRGEVFVSQYTRRTIKVLNINNGKIKRTLAPPAAGLKVSLDGETRFGALCGIDVASCPQALLSPRLYVANEKGRSILTSGDSPFSNVGDNQDLKTADTDPVLVVAGNAVAKDSETGESEVETSEVAKSEVVTSYELAQNYPNPFSPPERGFAGNPSTTIRFALPEAVEVRLKIYDVAGQLVQTLVDGVVEAGRHQVIWDGTNQHGVQVASGVYFYQLRAGEFKQVQKMSLVR